jgi:hypothetical protein
MHNDMRDYKIAGQVVEQHETVEFQVRVKRIKLTVHSESKVQELQEWDKSRKKKTNICIFGFITLKSLSA